ncbi:uncharacterized protein BT62DRAFT_931598 [Guyanagaster necrorhizus]|uniref:Uncharacterized protein n=1 Tax=Guyanagaster necrorhizus TaxID=856835 RepID=A0A9P7VUX6_9AGAR|nr:uncharacterized protein BT62DRAFT_931598 [Guyanagaster necrorhizus MCA 3950]KAG7447027.1 hypothetical protein BT62DRAFT_931598 [Guyanagaster necrorhizus MCA 3950]
MRAPYCLTLATVLASPTFAAPMRYEVSQQSPYLTRFREADTGGGIALYMKRISGSLRGARVPSYLSPSERPDEDVFHARALEDTVFISVRPTHVGTQKFIVGNQILGIAEGPRTLTPLLIASLHDQSRPSFGREQGLEELPPPFY